MKRRPGARALVTRVLLIVAVIGLLEIAPRVGLISHLTLIPPSKMVRSLARSIANGSILGDLAATGVEIIVGFLLAAVSGLLIGYLLWRFRIVKRMLDPYLTSYYALPVFVFYPLLIGIFGLGHIPPIILGWAYAAIAVVTNTVIGLASVKRVYLKTAAVYRLRKARTFWQIQLPAAAPQIFTGLKLAATYAVIGVIACEFILSTSGLGHRVSFDYESFNLSGMYSAILLVLLIAFIATVLVSTAEHFVLNKRR